MTWIIVAEGLTDSPCWQACRPLEPGLRQRRRARAQSGQEGGGTSLTSVWRPIMLALCSLAGQLHPMRLQLAVLPASSVGLRGQKEVEEKGREGGATCV